jgi:hypothetical protein
MEAKFVEKALKELGETKLKREQSLQQFREWLVKHPLLKDIRQGLS